MAKADRITVTCPKCGDALSAPRDAVGKRARCEQCRHTFTIAKPEPKTPSPAPESKAQTTQPPRQPAPAKAFQYDAFISYRHLDLDRRWAKWIHREIESYRVPSSLVASLGIPARLTRVFRDEDELPASADLNQEIERALAASRFLIVVCSRDTPESKWVNAEVLRFRQLGRANRIVALLVDGSPAESFPKALRFEKRRKTDSAGKTRIVRREIEPLAADVRPRKSESERHLRRMAKLRILACLLGCKFDDLRQRHLERRKRRKVQWSSVAATVLLITATGFGYAIIQSMRAGGLEEELGERSTQLEEAQGEIEEKVQQVSAAETETAEAKERKKIAEESEARIRYFEQIGGAAEALDRSDGRSARTILSQCDQTYADFEWRYLWALAMGADRSRFLEHPGPVFESILTDDGRFAYTASESTVRLWDRSTGAVVRSMDLDSPIGAIDVGPDGLLAVGCADGTARLLDLETMEIRSSFRVSRRAPVGSVRFSSDGTKLAAASMGGIRHVYSVSDGELLHALGGSRTPTETFFSRDDKFLIGCDFVWDLSRNRSLVEEKITRHVGGDGTIMDLPETIYHEEHARFHPHIDDAKNQLIAVAEASDRIAFGQEWITLYDFGGDAARKVWEQHLDESPTALAVSPSGSRVAIALSSLLIQVFQAGEETSPVNLVGHTEKIVRMRFSVDGTRLISSSFDGSTRIWNLLPDGAGAAGDHLVVGQSIFGFPTDAGWQRTWEHHIPDPSVLRWKLVDAEVVDGKSIRLTANLDMGSARGLQSVQHLPEATQVIPWAPPADPIETPELEHTIAYTNRWTGYGLSSPETILLAHRGTGWEVGQALLRLVSPDLAFEARIMNRDIRLQPPRQEDFRFIEVDSVDGSLSVILDAHDDDVLAMCFSPSGTRFFSGGRDGMVRIWDTTTWLPVLSIPVDAPVTEILSDANGTNLAIVTPGFLRIARAPRDSESGETGGAPAMPPIRPAEATLLARQGNFATLVGEIASIETRQSMTTRLLKSLGVETPIPKSSSLYHVLRSELSDRADDPRVAMLQGISEYLNANLLIIELTSGAPNAPFVVIRHENAGDTVDQFWPDWREAIGQFCSVRGRMVDTSGRTHVLSFGFFDFVFAPK